MDILIKIAQLFLCFTILVGIHELGHFLMARAFKIRVEKFYIFFDPWFSLFKFKRGDTEYGLGWLPLGGYVKIAGMIDESMDKEQMKQPVKPDEFRAKPAWQRLLVMVAGVMMNVLLAIVIYCAVCYTWGDSYFSNQDAKWGYNFNPTAHEMGFRDGDRFVSIDGEEIDNVMRVQNDLLITDGGRRVVVERGGEPVTLDIPFESLFAPNTILHILGVHPGRYPQGRKDDFELLGPTEADRAAQNQNVRGTGRIRGYRQHLPR